MLRHQDRQQIFDWSGQEGSNNVQWAAFFSDCEHEVLEVTAGHRITLTYNLFITCHSNKAVIDPGQLELYKALRAVISQPAFCKDGKKCCMMLRLATDCVKVFFSDIIVFMHMHIRRK